MPTTPIGNGNLGKETRGDGVPGFALGGKRDSDGTSWKIFAGAAVVVVVVLAALIAYAFVGKAHQPAAAQGAKVLPADEYAATLPISDIKMSEADSFAGAKATYIDATIANTGSKTLTAATLQVVFRDDLGQFAQRDLLPLTLVRTREPYVDTMPVSSAPIKPGGKADFRLIFDHVAPEWNHQYPVITVVETTLK